MAPHCMICQELFGNSHSKPEGVVSALVCGHTFHSRCITSWLQRSNTCPTCRKPAHSASMIKQLFFSDNKAPNCQKLECLKEGVEHYLVATEEKTKEATYYRSHVDAMRKDIAETTRESEECERLKLVPLRNAVKKNRSLQHDYDALDARHANCKRFERLLSTQSHVNAALLFGECDEQTKIRLFRALTKRRDEMKKEKERLATEFRLKSIAVRRLTDESNRLRKRTVERKGDTSKADENISHKSDKARASRIPTSSPRKTKPDKRRRLRPLNPRLDYSDIICLD